MGECIGNGGRGQASIWYADIPSTTHASVQLEIEFGDSLNGWTTCDWIKQTK